jgi:hypothetical protein
MNRLFCRAASALAVLCVCVSVLSADTLAFKNPGFEEYANDSTPTDWEVTRNASYTVMIDTAVKHSGNAALRIAYVPDSDTTQNTQVQQALPQTAGAVDLHGKIVVCSLWVKQDSFPGWFNVMITFQKGIGGAGGWTDLGWDPRWGNEPGTYDWKQVATQPDTFEAGANVWNFILHVSKTGTIWFDDLRFTIIDSIDVTGVNGRAPQADRGIAISSEQVRLPNARSSQISVLTADGRLVARRSHRAEEISLKELNLNRGYYIVEVVTTTDRVRQGVFVNGR